VRFAILKGSSSDRFCTKTARTLEKKVQIKHVKIYKDGLKKDGKVRCAEYGLQCRTRSDY
jgi:hypothetical protein